jgi:hypothetical protein
MEAKGDGLIMEWDFSPGKVIEGRTVIASCEWQDATDRSMATILVLDKEPPYYCIVEYAFDNPRGVVLGIFENIVPATVKYQNLTQVWGGFNNWATFDGPVVTL